MWDALKCTITGVCIEYFSRKKKERNAEKAKLLKDIEKVNLLIDSDPSNDLLSQLEKLQLELNQILDNETKGLIICSRPRWMEEGEKKVLNTFAILKKGFVRGKTLPGLRKMMIK